MLNLKVENHNMIFPIITYNTAPFPIFEPPKKFVSKSANVLNGYTCRCVFKFDAIGREILGIAVPAALAVAADPVASLIDTAFVGHIGPVELAAVGVSIAIFNQASRITIFPLVSITTSFVAEEDTIGNAAKNKAKVDIEKCLADDNSVKVYVPEDHENDEKLAAKQDHNNLNVESTSKITIEKDGEEENKETSSTEKGTKELSPDNGALQDPGKGKTKI